MQPLHFQNKFKTMNDINEVLRIQKIWKTNPVLCRSVWQIRNNIEFELS